MTPIHDMKTRKATWKEPNGPHSFDVQCHGVFFEMDGREVGVVIRDQPENVAKPLIEAIAALPALIHALRKSGFGHHVTKEWHTAVCDEHSNNECTDDCTLARGALSLAGALP